MKTEWTAQGLGMLRKYLPGNRRLHVWTKKVFVPRATTLHTHPWDFRSEVLKGCIHNFKFRRAEGVATHDEYVIKCGTGTHLKSEAKPVRLEQIWAAALWTGRDYFQTFDEIHETVADEGAVTVIQRTVRGDPDLASVFAPLGMPFVSAEPRPATEEEIELAESMIRGSRIP